MYKRITLQKILSFQLARVQVGVLDVFLPFFDLKIMVKNIKERGKKQKTGSRKPP